MGHPSGVECTGGAGQGRKGNQSKKKHFSQRTLSLRIPPCAWNVSTCVRSARFLDCWHCVSPSSQNMLTASSARHWSTLVVLISATTLAANCYAVEAMPMSKVTLLHLISEQLLGELTFAMNKPHLVVASACSACWSEGPLKCLGLSKSWEWKDIHRSFTLCSKPWSSMPLCFCSACASRSSL